MASHQVYFLLMAISSFILFTLFLIILYQFCNVQLLDRVRLYRVSLLTLFCMFGLLDNALIYAVFINRDYTLFPNMPLWRIAYIVEAIALIIGFHTFCICQIAILHAVYLPINMQPPRCIKYGINLIQFLYISAVLLLYLYLLMFDYPNAAQIFYIILTGIVLVLSLIACVIFCRLLSTLNALLLSDEMADKLITAKRAVRCGISLAITICAVCAMSIFIALQFVVKRFRPIVFNHDLIDCVFHSILLIVIITALLLWVYQKTPCCVLRRNTVSDVCGCNDFIRFWCACCLNKGKFKKSAKKLTFTKESTKTYLLDKTSSANTGQTVNTCTSDLRRYREQGLGTDSKLTDYRTSMQNTSGATPDHDLRSRSETDEYGDI